MPAVHALARQRRNRQPLTTRGNCLAFVYGSCLCRFTCRPTRGVDVDVDTRDHRP